MTVHKLLVDGSVRELYKATGGAWGGNKVNEAFIEYLCEMFSKEVIEKITQEYPDDWVDIMNEFEKIKRKISLNDQDDFVYLKLRPYIQEVYQKVMNINLDKAVKDNLAGTKGAIFNDRTIQIPKSVLSEMIRQVVKKISSHTEFLLKENENLDFVVMVGGFSNSPIVVEVVKDCVPLFYSSNCS